MFLVSTLHPTPPILLQRTERLLPLRAFRALRGRAQVRQRALLRVAVVLGGGAVVRRLRVGVAVGVAVLELVMLAIMSSISRLRPPRTPSTLCPDSLKRSW